ncbi:MAG TPA: response regulator, partial [Myxococcaceae bacterium]|nr:response regulator [Myxococcaceae bacterium]
MKILLVEDDTSLREGMSELISEQAEVREAGSVAQALAAMREELFGLVVTDLRIGQTGEGGRLVLEAARKRLQPVAVVSASTSEEVGRVLNPHEPDAVLAKPFQIDEMVDLVERFQSLGVALGRLAAGRVPSEEAWLEPMPGVRVFEEPGGPSWVRMAPGVVAVRPMGRGPVGVMLLEGDIEVDGERRV